MKELEFNKQMTVRRMKDALKDIPDDVVINVLNDQGQMTSNMYVWFENLDTRQFVELLGFKPFYEMTKEERDRCV